MVKCATRLTNASGDCLSNTSGSVVRDSEKGHSNIHLRLQLKVY